jgi:thiol-disulfide isomerase/thioredoxin
MFQSSRKLIPIIAAAAVLAVAAVYLIVRPEGNGSAPGGAPALAAYATGAVANFRAEAVPQDLPDIAFQDGEGKALTLAHFRGKLVLLNLWATWCTPCREEMPALNALQGALGGADFEVVALSVDRNGLELARAFLKEVKAGHLALYNDPAPRASFALKVFGMPTTLLISPEGKELGRLVGPAHWDAPEAKALIEAARREAGEPQRVGTGLSPR